MIGGMGVRFGRMGLLGGGNPVPPGPAYDPSAFGLDALSSKYGVYSPAYRVLTAYSATGNLIRVRRSTDDVEADFGAVYATGLLDTSAVTTWLGGGTGYVTTLYDQSGNGYDATQATSTKQPTLDLSGSIPCVQFDGTDDNYSPAGAVGFARNQGTASIIAVAAYPTAITATIVGVSIGGSGLSRMVIQRTATVFRAQGRRLDGDSNAQTTGVAANTNWGVQIGGFDWTNSDLYHVREAASESLTTFQTNGSTSDTNSLGIFLGSSNTASNFFNGKATLFVLTRDLLSGTAASNLVTSLAGFKVT